MKKLLSLTILLVSHGLFGMDMPSDTTEVRHIGNATIEKEIIIAFGTTITNYTLSNYPPSTDTTLLINSKKIEMADVNATSLSAKKVVSNKSCPNYSALDCGRKIQISLNKKIAQERLIVLEALFESATTITNLD